MAVGRDDIRPPERDRCRGLIATPGDRELTRHGEAIRQYPAKLVGTFPTRRPGGGPRDLLRRGRSAAGRLRRCGATTRLDPTVPGGGAHLPTTDFQR
jgi:hypothetical protein